jgi:hypothetical protein
MFRPAVIWSLDEYARDFVSHWLASRQSSVSQFVKAAECWEDVRDHVRHFNNIDTVEKLNDMGVGKHGGTHVTVVMVAYGMGETPGIHGHSAYVDWADTEVRLNNIQHETERIVRYTVVLAESSCHQAGERKLLTPGIQCTPWIISDRNDSRNTLDSDRMKRSFAVLLDALCIVDHQATWDDSTPQGRFYHSGPGDNCVRLIGLPRVRIDDLIKDISKACAVEVANNICAKASKDTHNEWSLISRAKNHVQLLVDGKEQELFLEVFGDKGLNGLDLGELMTSGPDHIAKYRDKLKAEIKLWKPKQDRGISHNPGCWAKFFGSSIWQRQRSTPVADNLEFKALQESLLASSGRLDDVMQNICVVLKGLRDHIDSESHSPPPSLPRDLKQQLRSRLRKTVYDFIDRLAHRSESDLNRRSDLYSSFNNYLEIARLDFTKTCMNDLTNNYWKDSHPNSANLQGLDDTSCYVFSAMLRHGVDVTPRGGLMPHKGIPLDTKRFGQTKTWNDLRSLLLLSSEPIPVDKLKW